MNSIRLVLSDYDRTFTDETLRVAPGLAEAIRRLRDRGVLFSIVSGRKYSFMIDFYRSMEGLVDSFIAENGCVGYAGGCRQVIAEAGGREELLQELGSRSIGYDAGDVVISVHRRHLPEVEEVLKFFPAYHMIQNVDSLMLLPQGASKATGIRWLMDVYCLGPGQMACIGDAENDIEMRGLCRLMGAVANALPAVKSESDYVCKRSFGAGLLEFLEHIERLQEAGPAEITG
ncbi:MAG: Phosphoglycolate phosphatase [Methanocella sp. PtaU1.Bin125]|nr:MAG: Phosphoglycolate phosphatase [Methanocella sp. PtaU1.Bin125]